MATHSVSSASSISTARPSTIISSSTSRAELISIFERYQLICVPCGDPCYEKESLGARTAMGYTNPCPVCGERVREVIKNRGLLELKAEVLASVFVLVVPVSSSDSSSPFPIFPSEKIGFTLSRDIKEDYLRTIELNAHVRGSLIEKNSLSTAPN